MTFGGIAKDSKEEVLRGAEAAGNIFSLLTWFTFGAVVVVIGIEQISWNAVVYAVLSLTLVRMLRSGSA